MGYEYGDAQNIAVRCFLNQFSKNFQYFDEYYKNQTLEYFDYKCPYTGVELTSSNMVKDHVIPFNKKSCGLHVFGNVLIVDKKANSDKSSKSIEEYLKNYPERLQKKKKFIKVTGYLEIHEKYQQYLCESCNKLYDEIYNIVNDDSKIMDYALNNSKYKEILDLNDSLITEYHSKLFNLLNVDVDKNDLKYLDVWYSLGLSDNMFSKIELLNADEESYVLDYILTDTNLENVYKELKKLLPNSINC